MLHYTPSHFTARVSLSPKRFHPSHVVFLRLFCLERVVSYYSPKKKIEKSLSNSSREKEKAKDRIKVLT